MLDDTDEVSVTVAPRIRRVAAPKASPTSDDVRPVVVPAAVARR